MTALTVDPDELADLAARLETFARRGDSFAATLRRAESTADAASPAAQRQLEAGLALVLDAIERLDALSRSVGRSSELFAVEGGGALAALLGASVFTVAAGASARRSGRLAPRGDVTAHALRSGPGRSGTFVLPDGTPAELRGDGGVVATPALTPRPLPPIDGGTPARLA